MGSPLLFEDNLTSDGSVAGITLERRPLDMQGDANSDRRWLAGKAKPKRVHLRRYPTSTGHNLAETLSGENQKGADQAPRQAVPDRWVEPGIR